MPTLPIYQSTQNHKLIIDPAWKSGLSHLSRNKMHPSSSCRSSHSHQTPRQRPRLLRSSATQPSVTASNEMKASLVSPNSPHSAADLLNKVAYIPPSCDLGQPLASEPTSHRVSDPFEIERENRHRSSSTELSTPDNSVSGA